MYSYKAKVVKIVDGDTLDVVIDLGFKITTNQRIRLKGINTPETHSVKKDSEEYKNGMIAKKYVEKRIKENEFEVYLETDKDTGKFGRYIGNIWLDKKMTLLNKELVDKKLAKVAKY